MLFCYLPRYFRVSSVTNSILYLVKMGDNPMGFHVPPGNSGQGSAYPPQYSDGQNPGGGNY